MSRIQYRLRAFKKRRGDFKKRRGEEGFTLIELMVVVLIMGILAAIAIPTFLGAKSGAQNSAVQSDLRNLLTDQATAYANNGSYAGPTALAKLDPTYATDLGSGGSITDKVSTTTGNLVCMYEKSASGTYYGIGSIASGSGTGGSAPGTYYYSGTSAPTCPTATATGFTLAAAATGSGTTATAAVIGWTTSAKASGF